MAKVTADVVQCNSCGGVYRTVQADGTLYFHACHPDVMVTPPVVDADTKEMTTPAVFAARPNPRNENVKPRGPRAHDDPTPAEIYAEGSGVTRVEDKAVRATFGL